MTRTTIRSEDITAGQVKSADLDSSAVDTTPLEDDIAILGFKVAANGSLSKYNLADQTIDSYEDDSGIDTSGSTNEARNASKYYSGIVVVPAATTAFTTVETTTWTAPAGVTSVNYLVVAGGGAGGAGAGRDYGGGGGGAGGLLTGTHTVVPTSSYTVTVGAGGIGTNSSSAGPSGSNSVFDSFTSIGGGGGGYAVGSGSNGGSGGGSPGGSSNKGTGTSGQGNNGSGGSHSYNAAGGGGKGGAGGSASNSKAGNGGAGYDATTVFGTTYGVSGFFAGGGGAGWNSYFGGTDESGDGGSGGGGGGGQSFNAAGRAATASTGGGGGGGSSGGNASYTHNRYGGNGGTGVVLINYDAVNLYNNMTLISNATTAQATPTKGDLVMTYSDGAGMASIGDGTNGDVRAFISRDDGITYTQATLASQGTTGGHTILTAHDLDISSQPSGTSMRYKITTHNQSASLETRIQAVSLGWS